MTVLNDRCSHILNTLLWSNDYISLPQLVEEMKVSRRSIYYDICRINEWLEENDIKEIAMGRGRGILIPEEELFFWKKIRTQITIFSQVKE